MAGLSLGLVSHLDVCIYMCVYILICLHIIGINLFIWGFRAFVPYISCLLVAFGCCFFIVRKLLIITDHFSEGSLLTIDYNAIA